VSGPARRIDLRGATGTADQSRSRRARLPAPDLHGVPQPAGTGRRARLASGTERGRRLLDRLDLA